MPVDACLPDSKLRDDLECDSLDRIDIAISLEDRFDILVPDVDPGEWVTVLDVVVTVRKQMVAA